MPLDRSDETFPETRVSDPGARRLYITSLSWNPIYKISYDLSQDYRKFIVRFTYDSDLQRAKSSLGNIVS